MSVHDGVVTVADDEIPVIVELDEERIRLSASGTEIGEWRTDECHISHVADSTYTISAENETLQFVPNQPSLFAAAVNGGTKESPPVSATPATEPQRSPSDVADSKTSPGSPTPEEKKNEPASHVREAPPPRPLTMAAFYALCLLTAGLAVWSLISIIF